MKTIETEAQRLPSEEEAPPMTAEEIIDANFRFARMLDAIGPPREVPQVETEPFAVPLPRLKRD
jgi:hypothetical protein